MSRILKPATTEFDNAVTAMATGIQQALAAQTNNNAQRRFYFYSDLTFSEKKLDKPIIAELSFRRKEYLDMGYLTNANHIIHYLRSRIYGSLVSDSMLRYFNEIKLVIQ